MTISGGTLDLSTVTTFNLTGPVVLEDIIVKVNDSGSIFANGNDFTIEESVEFDGRLGHIFGGSNGSEVASTNMILKSGNYREIFGGGKSGKITGDTNLLIGGLVNTGIDVFSDHDIAAEYCIYGGSESQIVGGDTNIVFDGENAVAGFIYGGGANVYARVDGTSKVTMKAGQVMSIYGGSWAATAYADRETATEVVMTGGTVEQIFGGTVGASMTGTTSVLVSGGTVTRRIYGGCYNATEDGLAGLFDQSTITDYYVTGTTKVVIESVNFTHSSSLDNVISACSRNTTNHEEEAGTLEFSTTTLYESLKSYIGDSSYTKSPGYDELYVAGSKVTVE